MVGQLLIVLPKSNTIVSEKSKKQLRACLGILRTDFQRFKVLTKKLNLSLAG